jgi:hypothetical protein
MVFPMKILVLNLIVLVINIIVLIVDLAVGDSRCLYATGRLRRTGQERRQANG